MSTEHPQLGFTVDDWQKAVVSGAVGIADFERWFRSLDAADPAWIYIAPWEEVAAQFGALLDRVRAAGGDVAELPLYGVPFAVKDNIDVGGWPTTAACPAFLYTAERDAVVVERLKAAGAIVVGKTNMDQFATGLVGTRSPYGVVPSAFHPEYIAGGSSSGSASVVTRGLVPFSLGTDTAGSGRVPAAFGNIVGLKPTRGLFSTRGVVPACRTLDCVSVFAHTVADAALVAGVMREFDAADPYSRTLPLTTPTLESVKPRIGVFEPLEFFGDELASLAYRESLELLAMDGFEVSSVAAKPFYELARLLYAGSWVAERSLTCGKLLDGPAEDLDPVVRGILEPARALTAEDAFRSEYRRAELATQIQQAFVGLDAILVPTTGTTYKIEEVRRDPIGTNARLGTYTNFTNLSDLCGVAVPGRFREDGLPTGLTFLGPAFSDLRLLGLAERAHRLMGVTRGATGLPLPDRGALDAATRKDGSAKDSGAGDGRVGESWVRVAVVGAHLSGMALNYQLTARGARLVAATKTSERYRLFLLPGTQPLKPGLMRVQKGSAIALEVWEIPVAAFGAFAAEVPAPLGIGNLELADGTWVKGFICEPWGFEGAQDISAYGGFAAYLEHGRLS